MAFATVVVIAAGAATVLVRREVERSALVRACESDCVAPKLFVSTNESNLPMQALLAKLDYAPSGRVENLDEGDPELIYVKFLPAR